MHKVHIWIQIKSNFASYNSYGIQSGIWRGILVLWHHWSGSAMAFSLLKASLLITRDSPLSDVAAEPRVIPEQNTDCVCHATQCQHVRQLTRLTSRHWLLHQLHSPEANPEIVTIHFTVLWVGEDYHTIIQYRLSIAIWPPCLHLPRHNSKILTTSLTTAKYVTLTADGCTFPQQRPRSIDRYVKYVIKSVISHIKPNLSECLFLCSLWTATFFSRSETNLACGILTLQGWSRAINLEIGHITVHILNQYADG